MRSNNDSLTRRFEADRTCANYWLSMFEKHGAWVSVFDSPDFKGYLRAGQIATEGVCANWIYSDGVLEISLDEYSPLLASKTAAQIFDTMEATNTVPV